MPVGRIRLYRIIAFLCLAGYFWVLIHLTGLLRVHTELCPFKWITKLPCPSCGSTRSVECILNGHYVDAFYTNPLGYLDLAIMLILPFWLFLDIFHQKSSLYHFYVYMEAKIKKPFIGIPLILLIVLNWIWNIYKRL